MSANCPRCARPLEDQQLDEIAFRCCRNCSGMLILHPDLINVLESSWHAISHDKAEVTAFHAPAGWQDQPALLCPDCHKTMDRYGYMGLAAIQINRCDPCSLVWLDADELQNMVLALAKTNYRSAAEREKLKREEVDIGAAGLAGVSLGQNRSWLFGGRNQNTSVAAEVLLGFLLG